MRFLSATAHLAQLTDVGPQPLQLPFLFAPHPMLKLTHAFGSLLLAALSSQVGRGWASQLRCGAPVDEWSDTAVACNIPKLSDMLMQPRQQDRCAKVCM